MRAGGDAATSPAVERLVEALTWIGGDDAEAEYLPQRFDPRFLHAVGVERLLAARETWKRRLGAMRLAAVDEALTPLRALAHLTAEDGSPWRAGCATASDAPHRMASLWVARAPAREPAKRTVQTERLSLRPFRPGDLEPFVALCADPEVMRYIGRGGAQTHEEAERSFEWLLSHWERHGYGNWAVIERATGELIGRCGLNVLGEEIEVAYALRADRWGRGIATEAASAAIRWGFDELGLERIVAITFPENEASQRVLRKCGLSYRGETEHVGLVFRSFEIARA